MKSYRGMLLFLALVGALAIVGCVSALKSVKAPNEEAGKQPVKAPTENVGQAEGAKKGSDEELKKLLATPPPPQYTPPAGGEQKGSSESLINEGEKGQVSKAALDFAGHMKNVKHVKICYSKLYGGWYLMLYLQKGKKVSLDQYSWNKKSQEWEIVYHLKEIPQKQVEFHLKGEVGDEKCFVLK